MYLRKESETEEKLVEMSNISKFEDESRSTLAVLLKDMAFDITRRV